MTKSAYHLDIFPAYCGGPCTLLPSEYIKTATEHDVLPREDKAHVCRPGADRWPARQAHEPMPEAVPAGGPLHQDLQAHRKEGET